MQLVLLSSGYCEFITPKNTHNLVIQKKKFRSHFAKLYFKKAYNFDESVKVHANNVDYVIVNHQTNIDTPFLPNKTLHKALDKIKELDTHEGTQLAYGGLRVSNFINNETLVYVKARFINHKENNTSLHSDFFTSLATKETQTTFNPCVGFEWKLPDNLSIAGELSSDFGQASPLVQGSNQTNQSVLLNVRYQFDTRPEIDD